MRAVGIAVILNQAQFSAYRGSGRGRRGRGGEGRGDRGGEGRGDNERVAQEPYEG